jgi:hypothetical protein
MSSEARKIHLIEEVLKIKNEAVLIELEAVIDSANKSNKSGRASAHDFLGLISASDAQLMEDAIEEGCEQINADDWK